MSTRLALIVLIVTLVLGFVAFPGIASSRCDAAYPETCIAPPPPDLDCKDIPYRNFRVVAPDPHRFDRDRDGIGCESNRS